MGRLLAVVVGRVVPVIAGAAACAGCAQLAGIDDTSSNGRPRASVALTRRSIGSKVDDAALDLTSLKATFLVPNDASASGFDSVQAVASSAGTWTSTLFEATPVQLTLPDEPTPLPRLFALPSLSLTILYGVLEHQGRTPAPEGATLAVTVPLDRGYASSDRFQVYTVGSWTARGFAAGEIPQAPDLGAMEIGPVTYAFDSSSRVSGRPTLDRLTTNDSFLVLRYVGAALNGVAQAAGFDQTDKDTVKTAAMTAVALDQTLDVKLDTMLTTRYAAVLPAVSGLGMSWSLVAAPGYLMASNAGPVLHSGGLTAADVGLVVMYGNPFVDRHWRTIFTLSTQESRVYMPTATLRVTLFAGMSQYIEPSTGYVLKLEAGLPVLILFGDRPLSTDGQMIPQPTRLVPVTIFSDSPNNTLYEVQVFDLLPNAAGTDLVYHFVFSATSNEARFDLPPQVFEVGHSYTLRAVVTAGGFPAIASGDFLRRELPLSQSFLDSAVFTVTP